MAIMCVTILVEPMTALPDFVAMQIQNPTLPKLLPAPAMRREQQIGADVLGIVVQTEALGIIENALLRM